MQRRDATKERGWRGGVGATLAVLVLAAAGQAGFAGEAAHPGPAVRRLTGKEMVEAGQARDRADQLRAGYEAAHRAGPADKPDEAAESAFRTAEAAYQDVLDKYPGTDIAAYCYLRLAGLYQYHRDHARMTELLQDMAARFAGTEYESQAYFTLGLMHLQALHDPKSAAPWFEKVAPPPGADPDGTVPDKKYDHTHVVYISATQALAKCEIRLGKPADAARRCEALSKRYPQYQKSFASALRFEVRSALSDHKLTAIKPILQAWLEQNP